MARPRSQNEYTIKGEITLIHCKHCDFIIDTNQLDKVLKFNWFSKIGNGNYYAYAHYEGNTKIMLHRYLMKVWDSKQIVDHISRDTLDNRISNLRLATRGQNNINVKKRKNSKSIYKGLTKVSKNIWLVVISKDRRKYKVGYFKDEIEAAKAYDKKALELWGDFAKLNFEKENKK
jgi:hypothetical protein